MSVLDARLIPYLLPYPLTAFAVAGLSFLFPLGPFFLSWFSSERVSFVVSTFVVHEFLWGLNGLFVLFDKIHLLSGFKIKRAKSSGAAPLDDLLVKSIKKQLFSHLIVQIVSLYFLYPVFVYFGSSWRPVSVEQLFTVVWQTTLAAFVNDFLFYLCHLALHRSARLYKHVHSVHHEFIATTGFAAEYAHPLESIVGNQLPAVIVSLLLGFPFDVWLFWLAFRLLRTYLTHSGYAIPFLMPHNAIHHDIHHAKSFNNFGGTPLPDLIFGTYNKDWFDTYFNK